jgi:penicillin amidase
LHDPPKGYIVTANNKPVSEKYFNGVYESSVMTARANRIDDLIQEKIKKDLKFTVEDMKRIQLDTVDVLCI